METKNNFESLRLYIGIDVHKKQWSVSIFTDAAHHRTFSQPASAEALRSYLDHHFPNASVSCAYEATKLGYWIYRKLNGFGYSCMVVNAADIPTSNKESNNKTDPSDSRKIAKALRAGLLTSIHVPQQITGGDRQLFRYRKRLLADLTRIKIELRISFCLQELQFLKNWIMPTGPKPF